MEGFGCRKSGKKVEEMANVEEKVEEMSKIAFVAVVRAGKEVEDNLFYVITNKQEKESLSLLFISHCVC